MFIRGFRLLGLTVVAAIFSAAPAFSQVKIG